MEQRDESEDVEEWENDLLWKSIFGFCFNSDFGGEVMESQG